MSDSAFERMLKTLSIVMALLIMVGIVVQIWKGISIVPFIVVAVVLEIAGGGLLLYFWGKSYMARR